MSYGGSTNFTVTADTYWHIVDVATNGASVGAVTEFTWSNVTADGTLHAEFAPDLAAQGTPHWWLAQYGLTNGGWTFDQAETNNPDNDPFTSRDEYIADTNPNDSNDWFRIEGITNGTVFFQSSENRLYSLLYSSNLVEGIWAPITNRMGVGGEDSMSGTNNVSAEFYKVEVKMP